MPQRGKKQRLKTEKNFFMADLLNEPDQSGVEDKKFLFSPTETSAAAIAKRNSKGLTESRTSSM